MLPRILEPEFMDTPEEARDYDSMDHADVNRRFVDDLLAAISNAEGPPQPVNPGRKELVYVLDLGTGTAQIPIELCRRVDWIEAIAVDAAANMLDLARRNID